MAITISGANNVDKILATDGVLDSISGFNVVGVMTAGTFDVTGKTTTGHLNIGSNIQLGNAGVVTATTFTGNLTGNVNATSNLLLQIGGSEKFRVASSGQLGIGGANYGSAGQVLTSGGSGSAATWSTIYTDLIQEGNTQAEVVDTGSDGHFKVITEGGERLRVSADGNVTVGAAVTISPVGNINATGIVTATSFSGSGANLTSLPAQATIANNADNRVITGGSGVNLNGEANMRFDGATLTVDGTTTDTPLILTSTNVSGSHMRFQKDGSNKHFVGSGGGFGLGDVDDLSLRTVDNIIFGVGTSEKVRIDSNGRVMIGTTNEGDASADDLTIATTGHTGITLRSGTSNYGQIFFSDAESGTGEYEGIIAYDHSNNSMVFHTTRVERLRIENGGNILIGDGGTYTPGSHVHLHGGTSGLQQLRVQNHTSIGSFSGNYGSEFRHAYSSANHCMLIHTQEAATARRVLDISDSNGVFASFTHHKMGLGTGITSPNATLDIRTTNDDDAIRLVNTSTGNNGIQWWNEYGGLTKRVSMDYGENDANFDIKLFRADAQDDRPYGNVRIYTGSTSSPNMNFRVTTLGTVHQPNQPAFYVRDSVSSSAFGANTIANFDTVILNRGSHYNTSNGRFTAPIAGTYLFISLMLSNGSNRLFHEIRKNGSRIEGSRTESGTGAGQYQSNTTQAIVELAKGDYVEIAVGSGGAYGGSYSNFSGYLLG